MRRVLFSLLLVFGGSAVAQTQQAPVQSVYSAAAKTDINLKDVYAKLDTAWAGMAAKTKANFQKAQVLLRAADMARLNGNAASAKALALQAGNALTSATPVDMKVLAADPANGKFVSAAEIGLPQAKLDALLPKTGKWDLVGLEPSNP